MSRFRLSIALSLALAAATAAADGRTREGTIRAAAVPPAISPGAALAEDAYPARALALRSASALVLDQNSGATIFGKNTAAVLPIASITKLMTAMVVLDAKLPFDESIAINQDDVDYLKGTRSRLKVGARLTREDLLRLSLMASENRAASALARAYPGGAYAFMAAMNRKAAELGMHDSRFIDSTGLTSANVSTAQDLVKLVDASFRYAEIRAFSTAPRYDVRINGREQTFRNTNLLVKTGGWQIGLSKTGYISEAGRCLVMQARLAQKNVVIVLLDSWGKHTRIGDANRIRKWLESGPHKPPTRT
jgi:D-alanyl-D-alanine endopeptidase (penicillin-binding protein 7)